jgi:type IV pilus assembly protein PilV
VGNGNRPPARQGGALVLEALMAVAVFSIGVLGTIALHARSQGHIDDARYRGEATRLAVSLIGTMWAEDPATLATRYDRDRGGDGYAAFARLARRLPGTDIAGNEPDVRVASGPSAASRSVSVTVHWQRPGTALRHRYAATAVIGHN